MVIILLILITFSVDNVLILLGDYWCWSLLRLKGLTGLLAVSSMTAEPFFRWLDFEEYLCMLLRYSFEPMPNSRALGTTGSVITVGLSINECSHSKNQFDKRVCACGDSKGLTQFKQSPSSPQEDKRRLCSLGGGGGIRGRPSITMTSTRLWRPAVLVKTRGWVGCSVSRAR